MDLWDWNRRMGNLRTDGSYYNDIMIREFTTIIHDVKNNTRIKKELKLISWDSKDK